MAKTLKGKIIEISTHFINCYCNSILRMNNAIVRMKTCIWDHCWTTTSCFCYWERVETSLSFCYWYKDEKHKTNLFIIFFNSLDICYLYNMCVLITFRYLPNVMCLSKFIFFQFDGRDFRHFFLVTMYYGICTIYKMPDQHFKLLNKTNRFCNSYSKSLLSSVVIWRCETPKTKRNSFIFSIRLSKL